jgi:hypothetical protein
VGSYPPGTVVVPGDGVTTAGELRAFAGGFRVWVDWQVGGWATSFDNPGSVQAKIDGIDTHKPELDFDFALVLCSNHAVCQTAFGDPWARCDLGSVCDATYVDKNGQHPQSYCANFGFGPCTHGASSHWNPAFAQTAAPRPDPGFMTYFATSVIDVAVEAKGRYVFRLLPGETFLYTHSPVPPVEIPSQHELGFAINIITGSCCFGLGTPSEGCVDEVTRAECGDDEPGAFIFTPGGNCPECEPVAAACCDHAQPGGVCTDSMEAKCFATGEQPEFFYDLTCAEVEVLGFCEEHQGACCDHERPRGTCVDDVPESACLGDQTEFFKGLPCSEVEAMGFCMEHTGACCDASLPGGVCTDNVPGSQCARFQQTFFKGLTCTDIEPIGCSEHLGACCDVDAFAGCRDSINASKCQCSTCTWHKLQACDEIECAVAPIPTASAWGLAALSLLLMIGAKVAFGRGVEARIHASAASESA